MPTLHRTQRLAPTIRKAQPADVSAIHCLIESMTSDGTLLHRSIREIEQQLDTFIVADAGGEFLGCAALYRYGKHLAEVRSIAVCPQARGCGAGGLLLKRLLKDVQNSGIQCTCLFTRLPEFFAHFGFHTVRLSAMADKIAKDCVRCPRRDRCDETAMALGQLPRYGDLKPLSVAHRLVQL